MDLHPDQNLRCLLVQPEYGAFSFWNYKKACEAMGAKTPSPPLGLLTVAAILPQHWEFKLMDLNTQEFCEETWAWADIICTGGMLPQQHGLIETINRAKKEGKFVAVGGADPSSQPHLYEHADVLVVGEGEDLIPEWIEAWRNGNPRGVYREKEKPSMHDSPVPRYDLINFANYTQIGIQLSRGCPFNCEFCDIIELYGRKPRLKKPEQLMAELDVLKRYGYSGSVDLVDDNFIGNKRYIKREILPALIEWNKKNKYPFFYSTEASMNMADDQKLLELMQEAEFRIVFMGIETPDPDLLAMTQKSQNTMQPIVERVQKVYEYGIIVTAGFIMGFDGEKRGTDQSMIKLIEDTGIGMAMVGMLVALPNTQLTRRLLREGRLISFEGKIVSSMEELKRSAQQHSSVVEITDQTVAGLNYVTTRDRLEILREYKNVVRTVFDPDRYMDRALRTAKKLRMKSKHKPNWFEFKRMMTGLIRGHRALRKTPGVRWKLFRNVAYLAFRGPHTFEQIFRVMGIYVHFHEQVNYLIDTLDKQEEHHKRLIRSVDQLPGKRDQVAKPQDGCANIGPEIAHANSFSSGRVDGRVG